MRTFSSPIQVARHVLMSDQAWLLFVEVERVAGGFFRLVRNNRNMEAGGVKWQGVKMEIELPSEDAEGTLGQASITIGNISRLPIAAVESGELLGQLVTFRLLNQASLLSFTNTPAWTQRILSAEGDEATLKLQCGQPAQFRNLPSGVYTRDEFPGLLPIGVA